MILFALQYLSKSTEWPLQITTRTPQGGQIPNLGCCRFLGGAYLPLCAAFPNYATLRRSDTQAWRGGLSTIRYRDGTEAVVMAGSLVKKSSPTKKKRFPKRHQPPHLIWAWSAPVFSVPDCPLPLIVSRSWCTHLPLPHHRHFGVLWFVPQTKTHTISASQTYHPTPYSA
jgi:hypothetical protein